MSFKQKKKIVRKSVDVPFDCLNQYARFDAVQRGEVHIKQYRYSAQQVDMLCDGLDWHSLHLALGGGLVRCHSQFRLRISE